MLDEIFDTVIRFKQKFPKKNFVQLDDSIVALIKKAVKLTILWVGIISIALFALILVISVHSIFGSIFLIIGAILVFIAISDLKKKRQLIGACGLALLVGNIIGVLGSVMTNSATGWHLIVSFIIGMFGGCLMNISDKLSTLESENHGRKRIEGSSRVPNLVNSNPDLKKGNKQRNFG